MKPTHIAPLFLLLFVAGCSKKKSPGDEHTAKQTTQTKAAMVSSSKPGAVSLNPKLTTYVKSVLPRMERIPANRKASLKKLAQFIRTKVKAKEPANLTFICTHNSRRSHMSQLWAATAAAYYGVDGVKTFSGGTESTAFNPRAVAAMQRAGFTIENPGGKNPHYKVAFSKDSPAEECFSKEYGDDFNPKNNFAAVMTCSQADKSCPLVKGASLRVGLPYIDPKVSDGTGREAVTYDKRAKQIAVEMFYLMSQVKG